jgi:hypothetical protein
MLEQHIHGISIIQGGFCDYQPGNHKEQVSFRLKSEAMNLLDPGSSPG